MNYKVGVLPALLLLIWTLPAHSSDQKPNQLNVGIPEMAPYSIVEDNDGLSGYMVEIMEQIRNATDFPGSDTVLPPKRLLGYLLDGTVDCTMLARISVTETSFNMLAPIGKQIKSVIISRTGTPLASYDDLKNLVIGVPMGVNLDKRFNEDDSLNKEPTKGYLQSTKMLQFGRIDAMIGVWDSYLYNMKKVGMSRDQINAPLILNQAPIWFMCRKGFDNDSVKSRLAEVVARLREQGIFKNIIAKYLGVAQ